VNATKGDIHFKHREIVLNQTDNCRIPQLMLPVGALPGINPMRAVLISLVFAGYVMGPVFG